MAPSGKEHVEALDAAGFGEIGTPWQRGSSRIPCRVRGS